MVMGMVTGVEDLAALAPGPELGAHLAELYPSRAQRPHEEATALAIAAARQDNWARALSLGYTLDAALRRNDPRDPAAHLVEPNRSSNALIALLLARTDRSAQIEVRFAYDVLVRLPMLHATMLTGDLDERAARAFCESTAAMPDDLARHVCEVVLRDADTKTPAEIRAEVPRVAIGCDPGLAEKLYQAAIARRDITAVREPDGSVSLTAKNLPAHDGAASIGSVRALAKAAKRAGDPRPLGHLRTKIATGLLSRAFAAFTDQDILDHLAATRPDRCAADSTGSSADSTDSLDPDGEPGPATAPGGSKATSGSQAASGGRAASGGEAAENNPAEGHGPGASPVPAPRHPGRGIDVRVELGTLLGADDHPADLGGFGPITAPLARYLAHCHSGGTWRFALTDPDGHLLAADLLDARPADYPRRDARFRSSIEIILPIDLLHRLSHGGAEQSRVDPKLHRVWTPVLTQITQRIAAALDRPPGDPTRRFADAHLRRFVQSRTPTCAWQFCRETATTSEIDHTIEHSRGGPTSEANQWPFCTRHHALKSRWGWQIRRTGPHTYDLISHVGTVHHVTLPPAQRPVPSLRPAWRRHLQEFRN